VFGKIVVGFDGSETSENALRLACDIAKKYGSEIHLVHTPQPKTVAFAMGAVAGYHAVTTMPSAKEVQEASTKVIGMGTAIAKECGLKNVQTHIERGDPGDVIVACADECGADLIVTGRRGLGSIASIVQGSTSLRVNHLAKCANLSVV
jgi:nucleotide-binding universal stress UspA family protein